MGGGGKRILSLTSFKIQFKCPGATPAAPSGRSSNQRNESQSKRSDSELEATHDPPGSDGSRPPATTQGPRWRLRAHGDNSGPPGTTQGPRRRPRAPGGGSGPTGTTQGRRGQLRAAGDDSRPPVTGPGSLGRSPALGER